MQFCFHQLRLCARWPHKPICKPQSRPKHVWFRQRERQNHQVHIARADRNNPFSSLNFFRYSSGATNSNCHNLEPTTPGNTNNYITPAHTWQQSYRPLSSQPGTDKGWRLKASIGTPGKKNIPYFTVPNENVHSKSNQLESQKNQPIVHFLPFSSFS